MPRTEARAWRSHRDGVRDRGARTDRDEAGARAALGTTRFEAAHLAGLKMTREEIVDYALEVRPSADRAVARQAVSADGPLSRREMEVADLVAGGATNSQVAARLFI